MAARRLRGDLIETFKLLHGHTNIDYEIFFKLNNTTETRGHNWKLFKPQTTKGLQCRVNLFSLRVINAWNKLPCHVVSANSLLNDQPIHKDTRSFIYADDLCIATKNASFEKTESMLSAVLDSIGDYYEKNHLRANPDMTQTCIFHLRNRKANRQLNISWCGKKLEHTPSPIYLGVTLDRTLSYSTHITKVKAKTAARNNVLRMLANSKWGTHPSSSSSLLLHG